MPRSLRMDTFTSPPPLTLNPFTQLRAMFSINTVCKYACVTKPMHVEQVQLLYYMWQYNSCATPLNTIALHFRRLVIGSSRGTPFSCISLIVKSVFVLLPKMVTDWMQSACRKKTTMNNILVIG